MRTNIEIDDELMAEAMERSGLKTKRAVVDAALRELLRRRAFDSLMSLRGKVEFWEGYVESYREGRCVEPPLSDGVR